MFSSATPLRRCLTKFYHQPMAVFRWPHIWTPCQFCYHLWRIYAKVGTSWMSSQSCWASEQSFQATGFCLRIGMCWFCQGASSSQPLALISLSSLNPRNFCSHQLEFCSGWFLTYGISDLMRSFSHRLGFNLSFSFFFFLWLACPPAHFRAKSFKVA